MRRLAVLAVVSACGGGGGTNPPVVDAPPGPSLAETACGSEVETIMSLAIRFEPSTVTISMGQVVAFEAGNVGEDHSIEPNTANAEGLEVGEGDTLCFRFTATGTFGFRCAVHGFVGTVVVE